MNQETKHPNRRIACYAGFAYLTNAITAGLSYFVIRPRLVVEGDATATMAQLVDNELLARIVLVIDLALITSGLVTAILLFAFFRKVGLTQAVALLSFACMGGVAIMAGSIFSAMALNVAVSEVGTYQNAASSVLLLSELYETAWSIAALFFGLWLIPMGLLILRSGWIPRILGWTLLVGGVGYVLSAAVDQLRPQDTILIEALTMPATIGEFSMMIYLLVLGTFGTHLRLGSQKVTYVAANEGQV